MNLDAARDFIREQHEAVMLTYRRDGSPQMSPIACNIDAEGRVAVSTRETALKTKNLRRDPRTSICVLSQGFYGKWIQVDGTAEVVSLPDAMEPLIDYYRSIRGEHPDWDDYRAAMTSEQRVIVRITLDRAGPDRSGWSATSVAAAVLAAGRGSRLGGDDAKPLLEWRGRPLVSWAVGAALDSGLAPVVVVVGYRADEVRAELERRFGAPRTSSASASVAPEMIVVENARWDEGISSSLRAGLGVLIPRDKVGAVCIGLADQPMVGAGAYRRLAAHHGAADIVEARYGGEPGNPVKLARSIWDDAMRLRGDVGARALMRVHSVERIECGDTGSASDVDTLEDWERLRREAAE